MELALTPRQRAVRLARRALRALQAIGQSLLAALTWAARVDIHDVFLVVGLGLLAFGLWQIWQPLPYVVIGALLIRLAVGPLTPPPARSTQEQRKRHGAR